MIVLAFRTDTTRIATFMFGNAVSGHDFSFLEGAGDSHHTTSHHQNDPAKLAAYEAITRWHVAQYAYLLKKLAEVPEGDGTLLDNCMALFGSELRDGQGARAAEPADPAGRPRRRPDRLRPAPGVRHGHPVDEPVRLDAGRLRHPAPAVRRQRRPAAGRAGVRRRVRQAQRRRTPGRSLSESPAERKRTPPTAGLAPFRPSHVAQGCYDYCRPPPDGG